MKKLNLGILIVIMSLISGCGAKNYKSASQDDLIAVSNQPLYMIINELTGGEINIFCITQPGDSPHTYSPKPSDIAKAESAKLFFYVSDNLDNWAAKSANTSKTQVLGMVPKDKLLNFNSGHNCDDCREEHTPSSGNSTDPHFWLDPLAVKAVIPALREKLIAAFPDYKDIIAINSEKFIIKLDSLNNLISENLSAVKGKYLFTLHPSFEYFINRYGLKSGGAIEVSPGKEPSPNYIKELSDKIKSTGTKTIFSEPQLSIKSANAIAEITKTGLKILDPLGGMPNTKSYVDLIIYNALIIKENL